MWGQRWGCQPGLCQRHTVTEVVSQGCQRSGKEVRGWGPEPLGEQKGVGVIGPDSPWAPEDRWTFGLAKRLKPRAGARTFWSMGLQGLGLSVGTRGAPGGVTLQGLGEVPRHPAQSLRG